MGKLPHVIPPEKSVFIPSAFCPAFKPKFKTMNDDSCQICRHRWVRSITSSYVRKEGWLLVPHYHLVLVQKQISTFASQSKCPTAHSDTTVTETWHAFATHGEWVPHSLCFPWLQPAPWVTHSLITATQVTWHLSQEESSRNPVGPKGRVHSRGAICQTFRVQVQNA